MGVLLGTALLFGLGVPEAVKAAHDLSEQGRYAEAAAVLESIRADAERADRRDFAAILNNLGTFYWNLGRLRDAERTYEQSFGIRVSLKDEYSIAAARTLNNLGLVYADLNYLARAESVLLRAADLHQSIGGDNPGLGQVWINLGKTYQAESRFNEAETMFRRSIDLLERERSPSHELAKGLNNLGVLLRSQGRYEEAESRLRRALELWREELGEKHPLVASGFNNLGVLYTSQGRLGQADEYLAAAIRIGSQVLPAGHPNLALYQISYATLLRKLDRKKEARQLETSARLARDKYMRENFLGHTVDTHAFRKFR
jgi:tetratricopeptide (TPR) repeat protein